MPKNIFRLFLLIVLVAGFCGFESHDASAEGQLREWLKNRRQGNTEGSQQGGFFDDGLFDEEDGEGHSCAERSKSVSKLMNSRLGKRAKGPDADLKDIAYGEKERQKLDVFYPTTKDRSALAPIIFMVHGGGWCIGDKALKGTTANKVARWLPKGFMFVTVNYRMVLDGSLPVSQAEDVARAIAYVQKNAADWGGDGERIILMGHSAGAHLVSLVNADARIRERMDVKPVLGTISLDSGATNVPVQMPNVLDPVKGIYKDAFGTDEAYWIEASPYHHLDKTASPWLGVCSSKRKDKPCDQAAAYSAKSGSLGVKAAILPLPKGHGAINKELGQDSAYTEQVEIFMSTLDPVVHRLLSPR